LAASTLNEVAKLAGVSPATASRVLNGSARTPGTEIAERVRGAAMELGYIANAQAQALARASTGLIGLIVHDIADPYFSTIARGVQRAAAQHKKVVLLASTGGTPADEQEAVAAFAGRRADAIVIAGSRSTREEDHDDNTALARELERYRSNGGRVSVIGQQITGLSGEADGLQVVGIPNRDLSRDLALKLAGMPYQHFIAIAGPEGLSTSDDRLSGFQAGLAEAGKDAAQVLRVGFNREGGYRAGLMIAAQLAPGSPGVPTCIFAANDVMAIGTMAALRKRGIRVPKDIGLAGFDDIETLRDFRPGLSTVRLPLEEIGSQAISSVLPGAGPESGAPITGEVILRKSTALPETQ